MATTARALAHRAFEKGMDLAFGISTLGDVWPKELGPECNQYNPIPYRSARRLLNSLQISPGDIFVDFGCGKGRILVMAARLPFERVIGIEISPELSQEAGDNVRASRTAHRCGSLQIITGDAADYQVPDATTAIFFGNPFGGNLMRRVISGIKASHDRWPRKISFMVYNRASFIEDNDAHDWIRLVYRELHYPGASACLFETI
jgi:SAM-dependent methyltransferase